MESETLLEQYKRCTKINQDQLKAAKNIEDLVNIKIQAIDKALLVNKDNTYNFHYDPVFFRQQVPLMADREFLINQALLMKSSQRAAKPAASINVQQELFHESDLFNLKQDIHRNIAHGGLDIIRSRDPLYKQEMKKMDFEELRNKNNGSHSVTPGETPAPVNDPIVVLKKLFKPKEFGNKILDKNPIVNKYKQKHLEDLKKQQRKQQIRLQKQFAEDQNVEQPAEFDVVSSNIVSEHQYEAPTPQSMSFKRTNDNYKNFQNEPTYVDALHKNEPHKDTMIGAAATTQHLRNKLDSLRKMFDEDDTVHLRMQQGYFQNVPALAAMPDYEFESKLPKHVFDNASRRLKKDLQSQETSVYPSDQELGEQEQDLRVFLTHKIQDIKNKMSANQKAIDLSDFSKPVQSKFKVSKLNDIQSIRASGTSQRLEEDFKNRVNKLAIDNQFKNSLISQDRKFNKQLAQTVNKFNEVHLLNMNHKFAIQTPQEQQNSDQTPNYQQQAEDYFLQNQGLSQHNNILTPTSNMQEDQLLYEYAQYQNPNNIPSIPTSSQHQQAVQPRNSSAPHQPSKLLRKTFGPQSNQSKNTAINQQQQDQNNTGTGFKSAKHRNFVFQQMMKIEKIDRDMEKRNKERQMEIKNKDIEVIIQRTKQEIKNEEQIMNQAYKDRAVYNEATEESIHQEGAHESVNQQQPHESLPYDQTYDYGKIEINQDDFDNGIENQTIQGKIVSQLNSEMVQSVEQFNAGLTQSQKDTGKLKVQHNQKAVVHPSNNSASQESKFSVPSKLNLQPFSENRASQVISNNQYSFDPFTNQFKNDVMGQTSHRTQYPDLHYSKHNLRQSQEQTTDNTESLTDTEDYLQRKTTHIIKKASKVKMLKTSLYEIREEGYHSNTSSPNAHMDQFRMTFSSKRFNRYPRFTIFLKKNSDGTATNKYAIENTISLNPQFLSYLQESHMGNGVDSVENQNFLEEQQKEQGIIIINERTRQTIKIDPFEKVILVKGIDNSILTSFRTLRKQNNLVSDTLKVIHNKFQPFSNKHSSFMILSKNQATKLPYPMTDDEDSMQFAATKLYLQSNQREDVATGTNSPKIIERMNSDNNLMKNNTASFGGLLNQNQIANLGYSLIIGDTQINLDQVGETERKIQEKQKNLHDNIADSKSPQTDKNIRKKLTSSNILNAGGAGGGIRQNAKVIKSKNAFLVGTGPWNTQAAPKILGNEVSSELGNLIQENMLSNQLDIKDSSFANKRMTEHIDQSHIDSIEENTSLVIDQSHIQTYHPNASTFNNGQQNILVSHEHDIEANPRNTSLAAQPHALGLMGNTLTNDSLETKDKRQKSYANTNQILLSQRPQGIKVETSYKPRITPLNNNDLGQQSAQESSLHRNKSIKPVYRLTHYDPMLNAFPDSVNSTVLSGSIINTSMLPGVMTATIKPNIKNQATSSNAVDGLIAQEAAIGQPEIIKEGGFRGKKIGMAATARSNNLRASHAGGFVFEPNSAKNTNISFGVWPKNLGQTSIEVQKSQLMPQTMRGGDQMTISLPPLLANNTMHNQYREVINRQYQERSPQSRQQQKRLPNNNQSKIKQVIDELYQKEKRYVKQYIREDLIHPHNNIFNLEKCYNLQTATGVEKKMESKKAKLSQKDKGIVGEYRNGQIVFREELPTDRNASRLYGSFQRNRSGSPNSPPRHND